MTRKCKEAKKTADKTPVLKDKETESVKQHTPFRTRQVQKVVLRFTPTAWAKLLFFRDCGQTEIGGFGITRADDLLLVTDFVTVRQEATCASISFEDEAVADFFDRQVDAGRKPEQFARIWMHSHPGDSAVPSSTDEETFQRVFGQCQWAVMFIVARCGQMYARLRFNVGPGGEAVLPVEVDYARDFDASNCAQWQAEFEANIRAASWAPLCSTFSTELVDLELDGYQMPEEWIERLEGMDPAERQEFLDELAARPDLWGEESEVMFG